MLLLRKTATYLLFAVVFDIFIAGIASVVIWFFAGLVLQVLHSPFLEILRVVYIALVVISALYLTIVEGVLRAISFRHLSKKIGISFAEMSEAILTEKLHNQKPIQEWTAEWVRMQLHVNKVASRVANGIMGDYRRRHRR